MLWRRALANGVARLGAVGTITTGITVGVAAAVALLGVAGCTPPYEDGGGNDLPPRRQNPQNNAAAKAACPDGSQDRDGDGTCTPSCAATKCTAHAQCDDASGLAVCGCIVGYSREPGADGCVFAGGPTDTGFSSPAATSAWKASNSASIDPTAPLSLITGTRDVGLGRYHGTGSITQSFEMPAFQDAELLAMEVNAGCKGQCTNVTGELAIAFGDRALDLPLSFDALTSRRVCLGDRVYGRRLALTASAFRSTATLSGPEEDAFIDQLRFVATNADACPLPGTILNGNFEGSGGWTTGGQGTTEVAPGVGTDASRAGRLVANGCEKPSIASTVSIPELLQRPALTFSIRGTRDRDSTVSLDNKPIATLHGTGAFEKAVVCLPEWSRGFAHGLKITAGERYSSTCNVSGINEVIIDDFAIASHPSCALAPYVLDGDFERGTANAWAEGVGDNVSVAVVHGDGASAHGGTSLLQLNAFACSRSVIADQWISAPARPGAGATVTGGPALSFWYRTVTVASNQTSFVGGGALIPTSTSWTQKRVCMSPSSWGRAYNAGFSITSASSGQCGATLLVDDLAVTIDPECPAD